MINRCMLLILSIYMKTIKRLNLILTALPPFIFILLPPILDTIPGASILCGD